MCSEVKKVWMELNRMMERDEPIACDTVHGVMDVLWDLKEETRLEITFMW